MKKIVFIAFVAIITGTIFVSCSDTDDPDPIPTLTAEEIHDLQVLREEEKLARDVYLFSYAKWGEAIFDNIASSEQTHMDKIKVLLDRYNLSDPALATQGEFTNTDLQDLYNSLTTQADLSLVDALKVGATIEDLDIKDIVVFESRAVQNDILSTYDLLKCGSRNHMRNYYNNLETNGVTYLAQFITQDELDAIIVNSNEQCGNN